DERPPREDKGDGRGGPRAERGGRGPRPERDPRRTKAPQDTGTEAIADADAGDQAALLPPSADPTPGQGEGQPGRRRGRRGGRGRDRDDSRQAEGQLGVTPLDDGTAPKTAEQGELLTQAEIDVVPANGSAVIATLAPHDTAAAEQADERPEARRRDSGRDRPQRDAAPAMLSTPTAPEADAPAASSDAEASHRAGPSAAVPNGEARNAEPVIAQRVAPTPHAAAEVVVVQAYELPLDQLQQVAAASGLEWVNSDADKARAVQEAMAREPQPVHVPRERPPVAKIDEGPLVLVETRKDLSQIKLPFEISETH
ncbi:MAG: ribonuclease E/G, partial [Burkholderiaceae bacterium]